ncbi:MAG: single-stranded DNA-binding protein [Chloroflexi bacterium]|nr:single-stranded DNA-binding protein [Chloroflexota bacterium]
MNYQKIILAGNATGDAQRQTARNGDLPFTTFTVGVSENKEKGIFFPVLVFGEYGETIADYVTKGCQLMVEGRISPDKDGRLKVIADHVEFGGSTNLIRKGAMPNEQQHNQSTAQKKEGLTGSPVSPGQTTSLRYKTHKFTGKEGETVVVYYETAIVTFDDNQIILDTGDWWTVSTQGRMNWVSKEMDLGYEVHQNKQGWSIEYQGKPYDYKTNRIRLDRKTGIVTPLA